MSIRNTVACVFLLSLCCQPAFALEPDEILVIVNRHLLTSERVAQYYLAKRNVPEKNLLRLDLDREPKDRISRTQYEEKIAEPVRKELRRRLPGDIKCLLTTYGVPLSVGPRGTLPGKNATLIELRNLISTQKQQIEQLKQNQTPSDSQSSAKIEQIQQNIARLQIQADHISGRETNASVDSELSMVLHRPYELYRWQNNMLRADTLGLGYGTMMVSRLDGPDYVTIKALIDKALIAEENGLDGAAYIDSRGLNRKDTMGLYDQALKELASYLRDNTDFNVKEETTPALFGPNDCPDTALYCGWYRVKRYVDAFDYVDGAVGYHIASFEAQQLRDPNSTTWCAAMIRDGITATLGPVNEPYLHAFPNPRAFFPELLRGRCLVEAYYRTKPFNSWQMVLIGDPLYTPFTKNPAQK